MNTHLSPLSKIGCSRVTLYLVIAAFSICIGIPLHATTTEQRIKKVEHQLELLLSSVGDENWVSLHQRKAQERMRLDHARYSKQQRHEIETLYSAATRNLKSGNSLPQLIALVQRFGYSNRAGCALLYLGQYAKGQPKENYLIQAIENYSDCYYGNGVQVGAYARYCLLKEYVSRQRYREAEALSRDIEEKYPYAVTHKGKRLSDLLIRAIPTGPDRLK